jgi:hypothetical protein
MQILVEHEGFNCFIKAVFFPSPLSGKLLDVCDLVHVKIFIVKGVENTPRQLPQNPKPLIFFKAHVQ